MRNKSLHWLSGPIILIALFNSQNKEILIVLAGISGLIAWQAVFEKELQWWNKIAACLIFVYISFGYWFVENPPYTNKGVADILIYTQIVNEPIDTVAVINQAEPGSFKFYLKKNPREIHWYNDLGMRVIDLTEYNTHYKVSVMGVEERNVFQ